MWRIATGRTAWFPALLLLGTGCGDLYVQNPNEPDGERALATPAAVESLIASAFRSWFLSPDSAAVPAGAYAYHGPALALSTASFQHGSPWSNAGMAYFSQVPRRPILNEPGDPYAPYLFDAWFASYRAISALRDGLRQIAAGRVDLGETGNRRALAVGRYVQGLAHGTLALLYDSAFVSDETIPLGAVRLQHYHAVMDAAQEYLADAADLAEGADFTVPASWMTSETSAAELARLAHSWRASLRAAVARTPAERAGVDWAAVEADVRAGIVEDWEFVGDSTFFEEAFAYGNAPGWAHMSFWVHGMADQSGRFQTWFASASRDCEDIYSRCPGFLVATPDTRFPQGGSRWEQETNPGQYFALHRVTMYIGSRPYIYSSHRYSHGWDGRDWWIDAYGPRPLVAVREMEYLLAEAAYRRGEYATVAAIVNETRTLHGLNATDAGGINTSCVPRLPDGTCGDLWEMLKWEKRLETDWLGPFGVGWYFDSRGWGDLAEGTFLQVPVPYREMLVRLKEPYTFGGVGGSWAAPVGTYGY